jgi:hypothetical protein
MKKKKKKKKDDIVSVRRGVLMKIKKEKEKR